MTILTPQFQFSLLTQKDAYLLPRIEVTLDNLAGSQWFSTLGQLSGYWQVGVNEED